MILAAAAVAAIVIAVAIFCFRLHGISSAPPPTRSDVYLLNDTEDHRYDRSLRASIRTFQRRTGIQMGVMLVRQLPTSESIEETAEKIFSHERLGQAFEGKGILLLWAEKEHQLKIEVSYTLEGIFTDADCRRLESGARTYMLAGTPYAKRDFLTELMVTMGLHYLDYQNAEQVAELALPLSSYSGAQTRYLSGGGGIVGHGYAAGLAQLEHELQAMPATSGEAMRPDRDAQVVVQRYLASLAQGIGDPQLPLLTEGSQFFRIDKPHAPGYLQRMAAYYRKAMPYRIVYHGRLAAGLFRPGAPVLPILLVRDESGNWLVDEAKAWAYYHLSEEGRSVPKYADSPYAFAWRSSEGGDSAMPIYADRSAPPPLILPPARLRQRVQDAEEVIASDKATSQDYVRLAELMHFEMYWLDAAAPLYEKALALDPGRNDLRWRLVDVYLNTSDIDDLERQLSELLERTPNDALADTYYRWFRETFY